MGVQYTKCPKCGHAVVLPVKMRRELARRIEGVPGLWMPTDYNGLSRGDEFLILLNNLGRVGQRFLRGFILRKYQGIAYTVVGTRRGGRGFVDKATVANAAAIFCRVRDEE